MTTVLTNGVFDILHIGHIGLFEFCKSLGDWFIVLVNTDQSARRLKGEHRPINCLDDRIAMLEAITFVDEVFCFAEDSPLYKVDEIRPDIYVKGGDYTKEQLKTTPYVEAYGGEVVIYPFVEGKSTTDIIERVVGYAVSGDPS